MGTEWADGHPTKLSVSPCVHLKNGVFVEVAYSDGAGFNDLCPH